jgi:oxygen-independent coproporphyrinogen-3 oxidase
VAFAPDAETTLEANPEDVSPGLAARWRDAGVTRISLGVQSLEPRVLAWMHRVHDAAQVPRAVEALRQAGFASLNLDLIYGTPPELGRDWTGELAQALALGPEHLSVYGLSVEAGTPFARWVARGAARLAPDEQHASEFLQAHQCLTSAGFEHYEVSNYARPGFRSRHNGAYWRRAPYVGLGPSAHSAVDDVRQWNLREWAAYDRCLATGRSPVEGRETLDQPAHALERLYLGLRTSEGVPAGPLDPGMRARWIEAGWAQEDGGSIRLTPEGWLRLDRLVVGAAAAA